MSEKYPLSWPTGWRRTTNRKMANFSRQTHKYENGQKMFTGHRNLSVSEANERVLRELRAMGARDVLVSTNLELTTFGLPRSNQRNPSDPGVAVYWEIRKKAQCIAVDQYTTVADNLAAVAASLQALRSIERHGGAQIMERAFQGFAQLPEHSGQNWRQILGFSEDDRPNPSLVEERFRTCARKMHPDAGGTHEEMSRLTSARRDALAELATA